jgi:hypothetical protein
MGRKSPIFDIEHLQLFSPSSFRNLLKAAGFASTQVETVHNRYPIRYWAQLFPFPKGLKAGLMNVLQKTAVGRVIIPLPAGNLAAIAYKQ